MRAASWEQILVVEALSSLSVLPASAGTSWAYVPAHPGVWALRTRASPPTALLREGKTRIPGSALPVLSAGTPAPCVSDALVLLNNTVVPGNFYAGQDFAPRGVAYDHATKEFFVGGANGNQVVVITLASSSNSGRAPILLYVLLVAAVAAVVLVAVFLWSRKTSGPSEPAASEKATSTQAWGCFLRGADRALWEGDRPVTGAARHG